MHSSHKRTGFGRVYKAVLCAKELSPAQKGVYAALAAYGGKDSIAYPHQDRLAFELSIGVDTLRRHLRALEKATVISTRRTQNGNSYTLLPQKGGWGIVEKRVLLDNSLSLSAKALYATLSAYAGGDGEAYPHRGTLLRGLGIGKDAFYKALHALENRGILQVEQRKNESRFTSCRYIFLEKTELEAKNTYKTDLSKKNRLHPEASSGHPKQHSEISPQNAVAGSSVCLSRQGKSVSEKTGDPYNKEKNTNTPSTKNRQTDMRSFLSKIPLENSFNRETERVFSQTGQNRAYSVQKELSPIDGVEQILLELPLLKNPTSPFVAPLSKEKALLCDLLESKLRAYQKTDAPPLPYEQVYAYVQDFLA